MKISTCVGRIVNYYGLDTGLKMLADVGFEAIDYGIESVPQEIDFYLNASEEEYAAHFKRIAHMAADYGLEIFQCHAPFANVLSNNVPEIDSALLQRIIRSIYATAYLGCPNIVIHPVLHPDFNNNEEWGKRENLAFFNALVPALKETGVTACIENLFLGEWGQPKIPAYCSNAEQMIDLIDTLNNIHGSHFAACLDTGHAAVTSSNPAHMLKLLGNRTRVIHVHDNGGVLDDHLIPGTGVINWPAFAQTLGEVGFQGTFNFEPTLFYNEFSKNAILNKDVLRSVCALFFSVGRSLADIAESFSRLE